MVSPDLPRRLKTQDTSRKTGGKRLRTEGRGQGSGMGDRGSEARRYKSKDRGLPGQAKQTVELYQESNSSI